jgi:alcohol dehydrogenase
MEQYFEFFTPTKILAGDRAIAHIPFELSLSGSKRPLLITDAGVGRAGLVNTLFDGIKDSQITVGAQFDKTPPDSSVETVSLVADLYRQNGCDSLLAIGGGSVLDTAKAANILVSYNSNDLLEFVGAGIIQKRLDPLIAIPTTAGTGSEVTCVAVITDQKQGRKFLFTSPYLLPDVAVIDPEMTISLPPLMTAASGVDALTHAIEAYTCLAKNPLSDAYSTAAISLIAEHLPEVVKKPKQKSGRYNMALAATMAGAAFSNSMVGMVHTLGHSVGSLCGVPHGVAMNILLPFVLEYNMKHGGRDYSEAVGKLLLYLAGPETYASVPVYDRGKRVIAHLHEMKEQLYKATEIPRSLKETGCISIENLKDIAQIAVGDASLIYNPVEMETDDAFAVLEMAYDA